MAIYIPPKQTQQALVTYCDSLLSLARPVLDAQRERYRMVDLEYMRENNLGNAHQRALISNSLGDKSRMQDITVPIIQSHVETFVAFMSETFLSGTPIFAVVTNPENSHLIPQFNALMQDHARNAKWVRNLVQFFRDCAKYNFGALHVSWVKRSRVAPTRELDTKSGKFSSGLTDVLWEGNAIARCDPYNTFYDPRVPLADVPEIGEFAGYTIILPGIELKRHLTALGQDAIISNINDALADSSGGADFYIPQLTKQSLPAFSWSTWFSGASQTPNPKLRAQYALTRFFVRILPAEFNMDVPAKNHPQIWELQVVNGKHLVYATRLQNLHNLFPMVFARPIEDGLERQTKSLAENSLPFQDMATSIWAAKIDSNRRAVSDRMFYDPLRIAKKDIESANPSSKVPVRNTTYNKDVHSAFAVVPFNDAGVRSLLTDATFVHEMANTLQGINRPQQGQFQKGNKTRYEFATVMGGADSRLRVYAIFLEDQALTPLKQMLLSNLLQYQQSVTVFDAQSRKLVEVTPDQWRNAMFWFQVADGLNPVDRLVSLEFLNTFVQAANAIPELRLEFRTGDLWTFFSRLHGIPELEFFRRTAEEKAALVAQAQAQSNASVSQ